MSSHHEHIKESDSEEVSLEDEITSVSAPTVVSDSSRLRRLTEIRETTPEDRVLGERPILYRKKEGGPLMMKSAKKSVRFPSKRTLASCDTEEGALTSTPPKKRLRSQARRWGWMQNVLQHWRNLEGTPSTYEVGESSQPPPSLPLTEEPMEVTIPTLVARINTHDGQLEQVQEDVEDLMTEVQVLQGDTVRMLREDMDEVRGTVNHVVRTYETELGDVRGAVRQVVGTVRELENARSMHGATSNVTRALGINLGDLQRAVGSLESHRDVDCHFVSVLRERVDAVENRAASMEMMTRISMVIAGFAIMFGMYSHFTR